jgi:hypothetical protein
MKVVFFKGNPNYGQIKNAKMTKQILQTLLLKTNDITVISSSNPNIEIPNAEVYVGFSRGSRYLKKCDGIKISIGGISGSDIKYIKNKKDNVKQGNLSEESINAHFNFDDSMKLQLLNSF